MTVRSRSLLGVSILVVCLQSLLLSAQEWQPVEIVAFHDFDDLKVKIDGHVRPAYLIGLKPLRDSIADMKTQQRTGEAVVARFKNADLFAKVVTTRGERLGLSLDSFVSKKHGFKHEWNPTTYPYCKTGWGAFNFNLYFLHAKIAAYDDNYGDKEHWRELFAEVAKETPAPHSR